MIQLGKQYPVLRFNGMIHEVLDLIDALADKPVHHGIEKCLRSHIYKYNIFPITVSERR